MIKAIQLLIIMILIPVAVYMLLPLVVFLGIAIDHQLSSPVVYEECDRDRRGYCLDGHP